MVQIITDTTTCDRAAESLGLIDITSDVSLSTTTLDCWLRMYPEWYKSRSFHLLVGHAMKNR